MKKLVSACLSLLLVAAMLLPASVLAEVQPFYTGPNHITFCDGENFATEDDQLMLWFSPGVVEGMKAEGATLDVLNMSADELGVDLLICNQSDSKNDFFTLKMQEGVKLEVMEQFGSMGNYMQQVNDGILQEIPVDSIKANMPNYVKWLEGRVGPDIWSMMSVEGKLYTLPSIWELGAYGQGMAVREDLLEKAGVAIPTTIDEWSAAMPKLKEQGVTGFISSKDLGVNTATSWVYGAYGVTPTIFYEKDGKIIYGSIQPECKQALATLADWYKNGYIDNEFATIDNATAEQKWYDGKAASTLYYFWVFFPKGAHLGDGQSYYKVATDGIGKVTHIALPTGPNGDAAALANPYIAPGQRFAAGTSVEKMEKYMRFYDTFAFTQDGIKKNMAGIEGTTYDMVDGKVVYKDGLADVMNADGTIATDNKVARQKLGFDLGFNCMPVSLNDYGLQFWNLDPAYAQARAEGPGKNPGRYDVMQTYQRPVWEASKEVLNKMSEDFHYAVITGTKTVEDFDAFVAEWLAAGGQAVLDEANAMWAAK